MTTHSLEDEFIAKLKKCLQQEGIDTSLLRKEKVYEDEIDYSLGDLSLAIFTNPERPQFHIFWNTSLGMKYLPYEKWSFKNLDEQMNVFIDDFIAYYKDPSKRQNFIIRGIKRVLSKLT